MDDQLSIHIDLCRQGHTEAFGYIVDRYRQLVYTLAFRLLADEEDAKDAVQETFIKVWQNIFRYKQRYRFSTWIYKIASNVCYDRLRARRKIETVDPADCNLYAEASQDDMLNDKELKELITAMTEGLTPKQKLVFTLIELEELEVDEVAGITGLTPAKIKSNLYLARKYIKSKIKDHGR